jgi:hypothetical protein
MPLWRHLPVRQRLHLLAVGRPRRAPRPSGAARPSFVPVSSSNLQQIAPEDDPAGKPRRRDCAPESA